jgi:hypothetical protein
MRQRRRLHKIQLVAYDLFLMPRWSLPIIEPSHLPTLLPMPRAPIYPRIPRKVRLLPLQQNSKHPLLVERESTV